ncbi:MAG: DUF5050 domain-containing protein [Oscillospiraceae bacterium]|jgi:hypothetical protein|nr:DUF5050 domain-containing protein [Oscillospiraceae bacterium]
MKKRILCGVMVLLIAASTLVFTACQDNSSKVKVIDASKNPKTVVDTSFSRNITTPGNILNGGFADIDENFIYIAKADGYEWKVDLAEAKIREVSNSSYAVSTPIARGDELFFLGEPEGGNVTYRVNLGVGITDTTVPTDSLNRVALLKWNEFSQANPDEDFGKPAYITYYNDLIYFSTANAVFSLGTNGQGATRVSLPMAQGDSFYVADNQPIPFVIDDNKLYYLAKTSEGKAKICTLKLDGDKSATSVVLDENVKFTGDAPYVLPMADGGFCFVAAFSSETPTVCKATAEGAVTELVAPDATALDLNIYNSVIYFTASNGKIYSVASDGSGLKELCSGTEDFDNGVVLLKDTLYFYQGGNLYSAPASGGTPVLVYEKAAA